MNKNEKLAAAPAASGGEDEPVIASDDFNRGWKAGYGYRDKAEPQPPSAASVSERAREPGEAVMTEHETGELFKPIRRVIGKLHEEIGWYADEYTTPAEKAIDALEQALTQQRGECQSEGGGYWDAADRAIATAYPDTNGKGIGWWGDKRIPNFGILRGAIATELRSAHSPNPTQSGAEALREGVAALAEKYQNEGAGYRSGGLVRVCQEHANDLESLLGRGGSRG